MKSILFLALVVFSFTAVAQPYRILISDLSDQWKIQDETGWRSPTTDDSYHSIYLMLDAGTHRGNYLQVTGITPFSVWCNGKLVGRYGTFASLSVDSLSVIYTNAMKFSVVAPRSATFLKTQLIKFSPEPAVEVLIPREKPYFLNFSILGALFLGAYFIFLFQSNPKLILDYFNFAKLFSIQERDENLIAGRITSSINLVMYLFICLWLSFLLLVVFHFTPQHWVVSRLFSFTSEAWGLWAWLKLSTILLGAIFLKLILLFISTQIFKFREGYATQALNFFRLLVFVTVIFSAVICIYFMARVDRPAFYYGLISILGWILVGWVLLLFLKLLSKAPFTGFHLFFYLCASEIFPLVICFQILFF